MFVICVQAVSEDSEKIGAEELQCKAMAANAQRDLDEALPALAEAMKVDVCFADDAFVCIVSSMKTQSLCFSFCM